MYEEPEVGQIYRFGLNRVLIKVARKGGGEAGRGVVLDLTAGNYMGLFFQGFIVHVLQHVSVSAVYMGQYLPSDLSPTRGNHKEIGHY
jgi:hypothetical protein